METENSYLVLIVDDDRLNLKKAQDILAEEHFRVAAAISGEQAIKYVEKNTPDLILLDISMPGMDGFETFREVRKLENGRNVPIIFLTAQDDVQTEVVGFDMGADDFIRKPFVNSIVLKRVKRSIESAQLRNKLEEEVHRQTKSVEEKRKELEKLTYEIMQTLAATIDTRDPYTKGHSHRVAEYSVLLAKELGWDEARVENLRMMALLHDVGKIAVPDRILNKPGRLDEEEFQVIKNHTTHGYSLLKGISGLGRISKVARHHHERYDGKGYPDGLSGEEIEIEARIVGIADAFDAMMSNRVYRKALPKDVVSSELKKGRGTQFDPNFLDVFEKMFDEGRLDTVYEMTSFRENVVDLTEFWENISKEEIKEGAVQLSHEELVKLYSFIQNNSQRNGAIFKSVMIHLSFAPDREPNYRHLEVAMNAMEYCIVQYLRKTDLTSRISDSQHLIILTEADDAYITSIMERIFAGYYKNCLYTEIKPSYEIQADE